MVPNVHPCCHPLQIISHSSAPLCPSPLLNDVALTPSSTLQQPFIYVPGPNGSPSLPLGGDPWIHKLHRDGVHRGPRRAIMNLNPAEVRQVGLGNSVGVVERGVYGPLSPASHPTHPEFQGKVFSSPGQHSPASHSWLLLQSAPRSSRTPV